MLHSNQLLLKNFFGAICSAVSEGTSDRYAMMVIKKFIKNNISEFPFVKYIHLRSNKISVDKEINSINPKLIGEFIKKLISTLFSDLFKRLVKRELDIGLLEDLKDIGVKI